MRLDNTYHRWRVFRQTGSWLLLAGFGAGVVAVYRWAEPKNVPKTFSPTNGAGTTISLRLDRTNFSGNINGFKTWTLWAGRLEIEKSIGGANDIHSATLTDIRSGALYPTPTQSLPVLVPAGQPSLNDGVSPEADPTAGPALAQFHAQQGRYAAGENDPVPPEIAIAYTVHSQVKLSGGVDFAMRAGDHFNAERMTIFEMVNRSTLKAERRILCDAGFTATYKKVRVQANIAHYDPNARSLECSGGVRGSYQDGTLQTERAYWTMNDQVLRCPESVSGVLPRTQYSSAAPYTAENVTVDLKRRVLKAQHIHLSLTPAESAVSGLLSATPPARRANAPRSQGENAMLYSSFRTVARRPSRVRPSLALFACGALTPSLTTAAYAAPPEVKTKAPSAATSKAPLRLAQATLPPPAPKTRPVDLEVEDGKYTADGTVLTGRNFRYKDGDLVVTGNRGKYIKDTKHLDLDGEIVIDDPKHHVTGDVAHVDNTKKHFATMDGHVIVVLKPATSDKVAGDVNKERSKGVTITCDHMDDRFRRNYIVMRGHLVFMQKVTKKNGSTLERTLTAEHAEYDGKKEEIVLFAPVEAKDSDGNTFTSPKNVIVGTKEGQETIVTTGKTILHVTPEDTGEGDNDEEDTSGVGTPAGGTTGGNTGSNGTGSPATGGEKSGPAIGGEKTGGTPPPPTGGTGGAAPPK